MAHLLAGKHKALLEVRLKSSEPPEDATVIVRDLIDGVGVAGREEQIAVGTLVDGVGVKIVPVVVALGLRFAALVAAFVESEVVQRVPFEDLLPMIRVGGIGLFDVLRIHHTPAIEADFLGHLLVGSGHVAVQDEGASAVVHNVEVVHVC